MIDIILGLGMVALGFFVFWTLGCIAVKICFKIADFIFG